MGILADVYQDLAMRTNDKKHIERLLDSVEKNYTVSTDEVMVVTGIDSAGVLNACLGLSGEVGELNDMVKKMIFHQKPMDEEHMKKELGDVMWYVALFCDSMKWDLSDILQMNVDKLKARYPEGFDVVRANNRSEGDV